MIEVKIKAEDTTAMAIRKICDGVAAMLIAKNNSYGDSALNPTRIFSRADSVEAIKVRIDDKLSRLMRGNGEDFHEDTIDDLMGYLVLLKIAEERKKLQAVIDVGAAPPSDEPIGKTVNLK